MEFHVNKKNFYWIKWSKIVLASVLIGFIASFFAMLFKNVVEYFEHLLFHKAFTRPILFIILPFLGLIIIRYLRIHAFENKKNKGIAEVLEAVHYQKKLPSYKIPSHFFNGLLTVIFGGTTGIEVSTVVATATMGELASQKEPIFKKYKKEFMGSAIASGIAMLFCSPLAGFFFSYETIKKQRSKVFLITHLIALLTAVFIMFLFEVTPPFQPKTTATIWHYEALPYFFIICLIAAFYGAYLNHSVILIKKHIPLSQKPIIQLVLGSLIIGLLLFFFPEFYGDGYHTIKEFIQHKSLITYSLFILAALLIIKPFITGLTLAVGGDGGIFAPSIFAGACVGLFVGIIVKTYFYQDAILINFIILGVALTVSASLHAPFTAIFLTCGIFNTYTLFFPMVLLVFISFWLAKKISPFTVYSIALNKK